MHRYIYFFIGISISFVYHFFDTLSKCFSYYSKQLYIYTSSLKPPRYSLCVFTFVGCFFCRCTQYHHGGAGRPQLRALPRAPAACAVPGHARRAGAGALRVRLRVGRLRRLLPARGPVPHAGRAGVLRRLHPGHVPQRAPPRSKTGKIKHAFYALCTRFVRAFYALFTRFLRAFYALFARFLCAFSSHVSLSPTSRAPCLLRPLQAPALRVFGVCFFSSFFPVVSTTAQAAVPGPGDTQNAEPCGTAKTKNIVRCYFVPPFVRIL